MFQDNNGGDRPKYEGNWSCSKCDSPITELPFQPDESRLDTLKCKDCHRESLANRPQKQMFEGNWKCSGCGAPITKLPFQPKDESNLNCFDCYKAKNPR